MKKLMILASLAAVLAGCAQPGESAGPIHSDAAAALLEKITAIAASDSYMYGHQDDLMYGIDWTLTGEETSFERSDVLNVSGDYPAIVGFDLGGIELAGECNLDGVNFAQMRAAAVDFVARGGIVTLSWHPRNPLTGSDAWDVSSDMVVGSILPGGENHEKFMGWLENLADFVDSMRGADGELIPIIWRPWHEHTGSWFWWGARLCTSEEYKALWRMTFEYLAQERGLTNLLWEISPNCPITPATFQRRYPGDEYMDIIGFDNYCTFTANATEAELNRDIVEYKARMDLTLRVIEKMGRKHGKPVAVAETGLEGCGYDTFWTDAVDRAVRRYPIAYVLTWRNALETLKPGHFFGPWPGGPSSEDFAAFAAQDNVLMLNDIK